MQFRQWLEMAVRGKPNEPTITLYRGDSSTIKNFSLDKADPHSLFGQGIYLTDTPRLARDYTAKGQTNDIVYRYNGGAKGTKQKAIESYIRSMADYIDENGKDLFFAQSIPGYERDPIRIKRLEFARKKWEAMSKNYEVRKLTDNLIIIRKKQNDAQVSTYAVPVSVLDNLLDADEEIPEEVTNLLHSILRKLDDKGTADEMWQAAQPNYEDGSIPSYRQIYTSIIAGSPLISKEGQLLLRKGLKELGYNGIKYQGGVTVGNIRHHAYVFWDEQGLKKAKI